MSEVLSQNEIESLLAAMGAATPEDAAAASPESDASARGRGDAETASLSSAINLIGKPEQYIVMPLSKRRQAALSGRSRLMAYEPYDFRRSDKLSKEPMRTMQVIHENFARLFTSALSGYLRSTVEVELVSIEQVPYEEYVRSISASLINVLTVAPMDGQAMLEIDMRILFAMIDRLLGGAGEGHYKQGKDLTDVEKVLARNVVNRTLSEIEGCWREIVPLEFNIASVETSPQFIQIVPPKDIVVLILFDIRMGDQQGALNLCIPYMLFKPIASRLQTTHWFSSSTRKSAHLAPKIAARLREMTRVSCIARLGTSKVDVETIAGLEVGQILPLHITEGNDGGDGGNEAIQTGTLAAVDLLIGGKPKFRGHIGLRGGKRLAVQIDDIITPPPGLEIHRDHA